MSHRYYRYALEGDHSAEDAQRALGAAAASGSIVRVDSGGGRTTVYLAVPEGAEAGASDVKGEAVSAAEVTKLG